MENATKALLMAAGILLTMLILMLLMFFKGRIVEFYDNQERIDDIANVAEFNKQFTNYNREKVYGYEIISLTNMVVDYNTRHSNEGTNDEGYNPIILNIRFPAGDDVEKQIWYDNSYTHLFKPNDTLTQSNTQNEISRIINQAGITEDYYGTSNEVTKLAKSIKSLIIDKDDDAGEINNLINRLHVTEDEAIKILKDQAVKNYKAMTKSNDEISYDTMKNALLSTEGNILQYYEYNQFKKAKFKCTNIQYYNNVGDTGRISQMDFEFTGVE